MKRDAKGPTYVQRVQDETHRFSESLLAENERLRGLIASLEAERLQLKDRASSVEEVLRQNEALRARAASLESDRTRIGEEVRRLEEEVDRRGKEQAQLHETLASIRQETQRFSEQYADVSRQNSNLANLYVASYRLHGTVDRKEVLDSIQEIVANLIGCEEMAVLELDASGSTLSLQASCGIDAALYRTLPVGAGLIGQAVRTGRTYVAGADRPNGGTREEEELTACVPLKLGDKVFGALALFRLLPQKSGYEPLDEELFDLLATQAATALYCSGLHARLVVAGA